MKETMSPPPAANSLAVTYRCSVGHHDIRFYRHSPVERLVSCAICGWPAEIRRDELKRHKKMMSPLKGWLM